MNVSVYFVMIVIMLMINAQIKNAHAGNALIKEKARINIELGQLTKAQMDELSLAQNLYFKTYKQYPSSVEELISKKLLRANFETSKISKNIGIDNNNTIKSSKPKNVTVESYINAHQDVVNSKDMKDKVLKNKGESIENLIHNF